MKLITPLCILLGTCLIAGAQGNPDKPGKPHRKGPPPPEVIKEFDKDGDGKLSEEERKAMRGAMEQRNKEKFKEFDKDGDGKLSEEERKAMGPMNKEKFKEFDKDGDGKLSEEEQKAMREARKAMWMKKFDKDGDGKLSDEERKAMPERPNRPVRPAGPRDPRDPTVRGREFNRAGQKLEIPEAPPAPVE